ncbi:hypothetical protein [Thermus antranikianii]
MRRELIARRHKWLLAPLSFFIVLGLVLGTSLVLQPMLAWFLIAGLIGTLPLLFPAYFVACLAVVVAIFSRLLVAWGIAPGFINFLHFPLAVASSFFAILAPHSRFNSLSVRLVIGVGALGILSALSWLASGGELLKPILSWLLFSEPFLILLAIIKTSRKNNIRTLARLALGLAFVQIPFAFWQAATLGLGDAVQGTFVRNGAGAHIVGAIALMAVIVLVAHGIFSRQKITSLGLKALAVLPLFAIPVLADAKQVIITFIIAAAFLLWAHRKFRLRSLIAEAVIGSLFVGAAHLYQPLQRAVDFDFVLEGLGGKIAAFQIVLEHMKEFYPAFLIGLGPGQSVSRIALAAQEEYVKSLPSGWVDLSLSPVTNEILSITSANYLFSSSSVWSGVSSWLGLFGDLGLLGIALYSWLLWVVWRGLKRSSSPWAYSGRAILVMGVLLGAVFNWLETPEFTLPWALYMSIGLLDNEDFTRPQLLPADRR